MEKTLHGPAAIGNCYSCGFILFPEALRERATSDGRSTSVGTRAIERFTRYVAYQNWPDETLPQELRDADPRGIWRLVNGERTRD